MFFEKLLGRLKALAQNKGDTSRFIHAEKFNLHLSSSWFKIRVVSCPCFFMVYDLQCFSILVNYSVFRFPSI